MPGIYKVVFAPRAERDLSRIPKKERERLIASAEDLAKDPKPSSSRKLAGHDNRWRLRVGDFRIIYEVSENILLVLVLSAGHRREVYRKMD